MKYPKMFAVMDTDGKFELHPTMDAAIGDAMHAVEVFSFTPKSLGLYEMKTMTVKVGKKPRTPRVPKAPKEAKAPKLAKKEK